MAKKAVATLQTGDREKYVKVVKMVKSPKIGAYMFAEEMLPQTQADAALKK
ncbi:MAG: DUF4295 family protein [Bacteroidaceae bacterium]|nr:DUF4295 family protein [Bacteroidaceae bacterium]